MLTDAGVNASAPSNCKYGTVKWWVVKSGFPGFFVSSSTSKSAFPWGLVKWEITDSKIVAIIDLNLKNSNTSHLWFSENWDWNQKNILPRINECHNFIRHRRRGVAAIQDVLYARIAQCGAGSQAKFTIVSLGRLIDKAFQSVKWEKNVVLWCTIFKKQPSGLRLGKIPIQKNGQTPINQPTKWLASSWSTV